jgi:hypothetical protein
MVGVFANNGHLSYERIPLEKSIIKAITNEHGFYEECGGNRESTPPVNISRRYFLPCSRMTASIASPSAAFSNASRNSALCSSLAIFANVWRCF